MTRKAKSLVELIEAGARDTGAIQTRIREIIESGQVGELAEAAARLEAKHAEDKAARNVALGILRVQMGRACTALKRPGLSVKRAADGQYVVEAIQAKAHRGKKRKAAAAAAAAAVPQPVDLVAEIAAHESEAHVGKACLLVVLHRLREPGFLRPIWSEIAKIAADEAAARHNDAHIHAEPLRAAA